MDQHETLKLRALANAGHIIQRQGLPIAELRQEVARELALRVRKYPQWIAQGKMKREQADKHIKLMHVLHEFLRSIEPAYEALDIAGRTKNLF